MTFNAASRIAVFLAGLMGAAGVLLAAASAHQPDAARLGSASSMLLFHAPVILAAILLVRQRIAQPVLSAIAISCCVVGATLFAGDLVMRQYADHALFSMAAPTGGTLLIVSWVALALAAAWPHRAE